MSEFYIGYQPKAPAGIGRFVRRVVGSLISAAVIVSALLVVAMERFSPTVFEWQNEREFQGVIEERPYPALVIARPGQIPSGDRYSRYLLVGVGKQGAGEQVAGLNGKSVRLRGKLIYRAENTMIEVMPETVTVELGTSVVGAPESGPIVAIRGEIVDSKCFSGVMDPGKGKVHRDCAVRCLSGGVPPVLIESEPPNRLILLTSPGGDSLPHSVFLDRVAEPIIARGRLVTRGDRPELQVENIARDK